MQIGIPTAGTLWHKQGRARYSKTIFWILNTSTPSFLIGFSVINNQTIFNILIVYVCSLFRTFVYVNMQCPALGAVLGCKNPNDFGYSIEIIIQIQ